MTRIAIITLMLLAQPAVALDVGTYRSLKKGDPERAAAYIDGLADMVTMAAKAKLDRPPFDSYSICMPSGAMLTGRMLGAMLETHFLAMERSPAVAPKVNQSDLPSMAYLIAAEAYPCP